MTAEDATATLQDLVRALEARGPHEAIVTIAHGRATALSYAELGQRALALARGLVESGVRPGDPVVLFGPNSPDWIIVRLALGAMGALATALDDLLTDAELATLLPDSGARLVFAASAHVERVAKLSPAPAIYRLDGPVDVTQPAAHWSSLIREAGPLPALAADQPVALLYPSGTTGTPKSFVLSHANILTNVHALAAFKLVGPEDRALLPLPLHHVYPLTVGLLTSLVSGTTLVLPEAVTGPQLVEALRLGRITVMVGVPRLYSALASGLEARVAARGALARRAFAALLVLSIFVRRRFGVRLGRWLFAGLHRQLAPGLRLMASGGARLEADLIWKLEGLGWEVLSGYGLAETAFAVRIIVQWLFSDIDYGKKK